MNNLTTRVSQMQGGVYESATPLSYARPTVVTGLLGAVLFAVLTFVGANIRIPLQPVPITLQTLFVILSGAVIGPRYGLLAQLLYVGGGTLGLPIFAGSLSGVGVALGPTGGYLLGFFFAPLVVGLLIHRHDSFWWQAFAFFCGSLTVLLLGVTFLTAFYTQDLSQSLKIGYLPFVPGDILKILAAVSIYRSYQGIRRAIARP